MRNIVTILFLICFLSGFGRKVYPGRFGDNGFYANKYSGGIDIQPGDTVVLRSSEPRTYFQLDNYHGTPSAPIVIINEGGQVSMGAFAMYHAQYVKVTGTGDGATFYGFKVTGAGGPAFAFIGRCRDITIDHIESYKCTYGLWAKTDASCSVDSTNYSSGWLMQNFDIGYYKFMNTGQDVIYAGNTNPSGINCSGTQKYPMHLKNFNIHHGIIDSANRTGIQLSLCDGGSIHDNVITRMGYEFNQQQGTGISIGGESHNIRVYNNTVKYTFLYGILNLGAARNYVDSNSVDSVGMLPINSFVNIDSLSTALGTAIHSGNPAFPSHLDYNLANRILYNTYSQPSCLAFQPYADIQHNLLGIGDSASMVWIGNTLGRSVLTTGSPNFYYVDGSYVNQMNLFNPNSTPISYFNYVCSNVKMNGVTPAATPSFFYNPTTYHYYTDCSALGTAVYEFFRFIRRIPRGTHVRRFFRL